ncbi:HEPN domain-containing protein [Brevundimonas sp.]|uniref:HEPN domain-containing protein n=1 Tax=Brevundimonas sp. TaxID=1871086 RepID=UPI003D6D4E1F
MEDHSGHVLIGERKLGATLSQKAGRLSLQVALAAGEALNLPQDGLVQFRAATGYFTLLGLREGASRTLFGVAGSATVSVHHAVQSANFTSVADIRSTTWLLYVEDLPEIHHVNGFRQDFVFGNDGSTLVNWTFSPPKAVTLECPNSGLRISLGQDFSTKGETRDNASMTFGYPLTVSFPEEVGLYDALPTLHRIRQFCSLLMGRVLDIERVVLRLPQEGGRPHDADVLGVHPVRRSRRPERKIVNFDGPEVLSTLLDAWMSRAEALDEAIELHFQGLEQDNLGLPLRFQLFVQAIEAAHRRSGARAGSPIDVDPVAEALKENGIASDVIDRVKGMLAHAHEPGLRQRLKTYWDTLEAELVVLRPDHQKKPFISRLVATRNFYAHRLDLTSDVLQGEDLWDATEFVKAISHLVLLQAIDADISGVGQRMLDEYFVRFAIRN